MSTNLSVIKNPRVQSDQRRLVRRPDVKPNRPLIVILSTVALDAVGIGLIMPVLPGLLRDLVPRTTSPPTMAFCWRCMR